jgi:hypothetical protein
MRGVYLQICDDIQAGRVYNGFNSTRKEISDHEKIVCDPAVLPAAERLQPV